LPSEQMSSTLNKSKTLRLRTAISAATLVFASAASAQSTNIVDPPPHITPPTSAVKNHPRMWLRSKDVTRLQSWAVPSNPIWVDFKTVANNMKADMIQNKVPQLDSGDGEGNGYAYATEEYAEIFAFMSLVDPVAANRADWAKRAHDLLMHVMNNAVLGPAAGQPFRTPHFATFNRGRWYGEAFPLVVDWCYKTFTPAEKATIRKVFIRWIHESLDYTIAGNGYVPSPQGVVNSPTLVAKPSQRRWSANNYWGNHARNIGMMSLALDEADDVPTAASDPKAGYLRDYIGNAIGSWMYIRDYAETHDLMGGIGPEGPGYSESSFSGLSMLMLALHTAGYDKPLTYGSGASLAQNPFWQKDVTDAYMHSLSPQTGKFYSYQPLIYWPAGFGDVLRFETIDMIRAFGPLAAMDIADGKTTSDRLNAIRWIQTWASPGGPSYQHTRLITSTSNYGAMLPLLYFMTFDPNATPPSDPRVDMPTDYYAKGLNRVLSRSDWSVNASWFMFISTFNTIDHQWGDSNSFSFYRGGEWVTKEWSGYGKNIATAPYQNNLSIQNPPSGPAVPAYNIDEGNLGGQYSYSSDGDPTVRTSFSPGFTFAEGNVTDRYNTTKYNATDVQHASRSIVYLKPDFVVVYDRATSKSANRYKRIYFNFATQPVVSGHSATVTTPKGQKVFFTSLLPVAGALTWDKPTTTWSYNESTAEEPMHYRIRVENPASPKNVRFLTVLQGADATASQTPTTLVSSTSGSKFEGAVVGSTAVLFSVNYSQAFTGLTYTVPASVNSHYVSGLTKSTGYSVSKSSGPNGITVTITAGGTIVSDGAGVLHF